MERLLVCTDGSIFAQSSYRYAAWFASRLGARVEVLYITDEQRQAAAAATDFSGNLGFDAAAVLLDKW
ncbi:universal stress protein [Leptodesmis sp.]|uniref:universal stress protein n=1 Tax=Leptodesmis sp. TaxID=3100501 RepID=UPI0040535818